MIVDRAKKINALALRIRCITNAHQGQGHGQGYSQGHGQYKGIDKIIELDNNDLMTIRDIKKYIHKYVNKNMSYDSMSIKIYYDDVLNHSLHEKSWHKGLIEIY